LTRKYVQHLKREKIISIDESELDRVSISTTIPNFTKNLEVKLDGRAYKYLAQMQKLRGIQFAMTAKDPKERLSLVAWELRKRTTPVIFVSTLSGGHLNLPSTLPPDRFATITPPGVPMSDSKSPSQFMPPIHLTQADLETIQFTVIAKVSNKRFTLPELQTLLSHWEADILSFLVQKNVLQAKIRNRSIEFTQDGVAFPKHTVLCISPKGEEP